MKIQDRFKFRIPVVDKDGNFKKFVYFDLFNRPATTCRSTDVFKDTEQCTGLNDCNGKLIYEGDIIRTEIETDNEYKQIIGEIVFWRLEWTIKTKGVFYPLSCAGQFSNGRKMPKQCYLTEVIGNIYENPELLEG